MATEQATIIETPINEETVVESGNELIKTNLQAIRNQYQRIGLAITAYKTLVSQITGEGQEAALEQLVKAQQVRETIGLAAIVYANKSVTYLTGLANYLHQQDTQQDSDIGAVVRGFVSFMEDVEPENKVLNQSAAYIHLFEQHVSGIALMLSSDDKNYN